MTSVFSPSALVSMTARRLRPIRREISWVRPPMRPFTDSRSIRSLVLRGSIEYSAVTQPRPLPVSQRGTPFVKLAVHSTRVSPKLISALPSACLLQPRSMVTGRRASLSRPSMRVMMPFGLGGAARAGRSGSRKRDRSRFERLDRGALGAEKAGRDPPERDLVVAGALEGVGRWLRGEPLD